MRRTSALLALFPLALALGACGDDGDGGDAAFCEIAEELAEESSADVDLDLIEEAADAAPSEIEDEMDQLLAALRAEEDGEEIDDDEIEELVEAGEAVEEFAAEECDVDLSGDDGDDSDDTTTTTEADDDEETTTTEGDSGGDDDLEAGEPDEPPSLDDPELEALAEDCFEGSGQACDDLFFQTDVGSPEEEYGNTCGGRFDESPGLCSEAIGE